MTHAEKPRPSSAHRFVGRHAELEALRSLLAADGPELLVLTGVPGIGKTSLLQAFARSDSGSAGRVRVVDCRTVEPTEPGFQQAFEHTGLQRAGGGTRVLCLDHHDHFRLLDARLRDWFLREVGTGLRLVLAARRAPGLGWSTTGVRTRALHLDVLDEAATRAFLDLTGVGAERAARIRRLTKGHPLAMELALSATRNVATSDVDAVALPDVVHRLTGFFLDEVDGARTRAALEAASTVRRVTLPILEEMLGQPAGRDLYETLASLPLVEVRSDGLSLHPTVHETIARWLRAADPARFTTCRRRAWRALERDGSRVAAGDLWRYTADVIYLIEDPIVREAFFPSDSPQYGVEPARERDHGTILDFAESHDGRDERDAIALWLHALPEAFHVVRDAEGAVQGYYCLFDPARAPAQALSADPVAAAWHADLPASLRGERRRALFLRRWLAREHGDAPSAVQGACWLDVKRAYLENRPHLRRVYLAVRDLAPYAPAAAKLGFVPVCRGSSGPFASAMLDFGPGSVDAWLARLLRSELGLEPSVTIDVERHALRLGADTLALTPRELAVTRILMDARGAVVSRESLLEQAWDGGQAVGSNVVEVLVLALRKKLGEHAGLLETVRGAGYRWRT